MDRVVYDLSQLPRVADGWTFVYAEHAQVERADYAIELVDKSGRVPIPVAALSTLLLGPGTRITHAAVAALVEGGASVVWCGADMAKFYAAGLGETRRAHHLEAQALHWADPQLHMAVVRRMYTLRFPRGLPDSLSLQQIRGHEGVRVREAYAVLAEQFGVPWTGRLYKQGDWDAADPLNRALSSANACLYGVCHACVIATGFTPGLGFVHTGKLLSFVYDIADLYKVETTVPAAFRAASEGPHRIETRARRHARQAFHDAKLLERIVPDLQRLFCLRPEKSRLYAHRGEPVSGDGPDEGMGHAPGALWNEDGTSTPGGVNHARDREPDSDRDVSMHRGPLLAVPPPPEEEDP